jgi:site-specific DNA-methyltransferase (adenine-specific)
MAAAPGKIRDAIVGYMEAVGGDASIKQISEAISVQLGSVPASSIRSYLNNNVGPVFERTSRGRYRLVGSAPIANVHRVWLEPAVEHEKAKLFHADCFDWLASREEASIHAVVTDPPYGLTEYSQKELRKLRSGKGGVWRVPPSFDGHQRSPLPRFTIMSEEDRKELHAFFKRFGALVARAIVPGGNVIVATNPLLHHIVASAMSEGGLELRGSIARLTMTMRGGDRPKNAHEEFGDVSVMPRSQWEPWVVLRRPLEGRAQDNLRKWKTGGFRRPSADRPFGDVIKSSPTSAAERTIAPHPSLKPQDFMRQVVRGSLPLGEGIVVDPFAGSGSTLAAANAVGYESIGVEADPKFIRLAATAIPNLGALPG